MMHKAMPEEDFHSTLFPTLTEELESNRFCGDMAGFFKIHCKSLARKATVGLLCSLFMNNCGGPGALITSLTQSPLFPCYFGHLHTEEHKATVPQGCHE